MDCGVESSDLQNYIYEPYYDQGVMVFSVGYLMDQQTALTWHDSLNLEYQVLYDQYSTVTPLFLPDWGGGTYIVPHVCAMDDEQILQYTHAGYTPGFTINEIILVVQTFLIPELGASVASVDFGQLEVGQSASFDIYLDNVRTGILNVSSATVNGFPFTVDFIPGEIYGLNDSLLVTVTFSPTSNGTFRDTLFVQSDYGDLSIPLVGVGSGGYVGKGGQASPDAFKLLGVYPNPFNASANIDFNLPYSTTVKLEIYDVDGALISGFTAGYFPAGYDSFVFDGSGLTSGIYFCRLIADKYSALGKLVLIK